MGFIKDSVFGRIATELKDRNEFNKQLKAEKESVANAQEALQSDEFLDIIAEHPDFNPEDIGELENNPDKAKFVASRYEAFKQKGEIGVGLKDTYSKLFQEEMLMAGIKNSGEVPKEILERIDAEINAEVRDNPEALVALKKSLEEHKVKLEKISALEAQLDELAQPSEALVAQMKMLKSMSGKDLSDRSKLSLEQRQALDAVQSFMGAKDPLETAVKLHAKFSKFRIIGKTKDAMEAKKSKATNQELDEMYADIAKTREAIFTQTKFGTILTDQIEQANRKYYLELSSKINKGETPAEDGLDYYSKVATLQSQFGYFDKRRKDLGEDRIARRLELLQTTIEEEYKDKLAQVIRTQKNYSKLDVALDSLVTQERIGQKSGLVEIRPFLEVSFAEIYQHLDKVQKTHLFAYLKKHNLHGQIKSK